MDDNENRPDLKLTDLSHEVPTGNAIVYFQPEKATIKVSKAGLEVTSETKPGSAQNKALTTMYLVVAIGAITLVAQMIGVTAAPALAIGLGTTVVFYLLVHLISGSHQE